MSKLHEAMTRAVATSDMELDPEHVKDADRVAAMGLGAKGTLAASSSGSRVPSSRSGAGGSC